MIQRLVEITKNMNLHKTLKRMVKELYSRVKPCNEYYLKKAKQGSF